MLLKDDNDRIGYAEGKKVHQPSEDYFDYLIKLNDDERKRVYQKVMKDRTDRITDLVENKTIGQIIGGGANLSERILSGLAGMGFEKIAVFSGTPEEKAFIEAAKKELSLRDKKSKGGSMLQDDNSRYGMLSGGQSKLDMNNSGDLDAEDFKMLRDQNQEGGPMDIDDQMVMVMTPPIESEMESDDDMEDNYTRFIMDEALTEEEEDMLMSKLEQDEELAMLFDKVIDVAQEFAGAGPVEGPGSGVSDSIPARLSDGEFVFTAKAVEEIGADNLMAMMKEAEAKADERQPAQMGGPIMEENNKGSILDTRKPIEEEEPNYTNPLEQPPIFGSGLKR